VAQAIAHLRPAGVDVDSGVEAAPGRKDPLLLRDFIIRAREAGSAIVTRDAVDVAASDEPYDWRDG
jgi:phosphoribosylanthranilate isomerase